MPRSFRPVIQRRAQAASTGLLAFVVFVALGLCLGVYLGNEGARQAERRAGLASARKAAEIAEELNLAIAERSKALQLLSHMPAVVKRNGTESKAFSEFLRIYPEFRSVTVHPKDEPLPAGAFRLTATMEDGTILAGTMGSGWPAALLSEKNDLGVDQNGDSSVLVGPEGAYEKAAGAAPAWKAIRMIKNRSAEIVRWDDGSLYQTALARLKKSSMVDLNLAIVMGIPSDRLDELKDRAERNGILFGFLFGLIPGAMAWFSIGRSTSRLRAANEILEHRVFERTSELEAAERSFRSIFENAPLGLYQCDPEGRLLKVNPKLATILGYESPEAMISGIGAMQALGDTVTRARFLTEVRAAGESESTFAALRRDGQPVRLTERARAIYDAHGQLALVEGAIHDVSAQHALEEQLRKIGATDPLTGILNRRGFEEKVDKAAYPVSFVVLDVDRFKDFNDTYGHLAGDHALQKVATLLSDAVGDSGSVARIGGEEFVVVFPRTEARQAGKTAETLRKIVEACDTLETSLTISGGVATAHRPANFTEALAAADRALYLAKEAGRNRITLNTANLA